MLRSENSHFLESLRGMASIKALAIGDRRQGIWNNYLVDRVGAELRVGKIDMIFAISSTLLFGLDRIVIIFFGARAVMGGALSVGMLVAFLAYKDQFSQRVGKLPGHDRATGDFDSAWRADRGHRARRTGAGRHRPYRRSAATIISPKAGLSARGISFRYSDNEREGDRRFRPRCRARRMRRDRRAVRRGQDDTAQDPRRSAAPDRRHGADR